MNKGVLYAIGAYSLWGFFPIYLKTLSAVPAFQITAHRVVWSFALLTIILLARREVGKLLAALSPRLLLIYLAAGALLAVNWLVFVWAVVSGYVVEASLGYFINPLVSVLLGMVFLRERLRAWQWVPVGLAAAGVLWLTLSLGVPPWIALALALHIIFTRTTFGRQVIAVGSNERATRLSGVNVNAIKRRIYALMGFLVSISAILQVSRIGSMDYANAGSGYEMDAISAVIVGGTSMMGGKGSIIGTVLGALIIAVMNNLLNLLGVPPFLREAFKGVIVIGAVLLQKKESNS